MYFLVDTGTSSTCLNPRDAKELSVPFDQLGNISELYGVGGAAAYFRELAFLEFTTMVEHDSMECDYLLRDQQRVTRYYPRC